MGLSASSPFAAGAGAFSSSPEVPVTTAVSFSFGEIRSTLDHGISSAATLAGERPLHHPASEAGTPTKPTLRTASAPAATHIVVFRMFVGYSCGGLPAGAVDQPLDDQDQGEA